MHRRLIDEFVLLIHPLILGTGGRLLVAGSLMTALRLIDVKPTTSGVMVARYQPAN
jgi:hypothetical protein